MVLNIRGKSTQFHPVEFIAKYSIYFITLVLVIICSFLTDRFFTASNMLNILRQISIYAMIAFAESVLLISGNLDLSAGSIVALTGCISIQMYFASGNNLFIAFIFAILIGMLVSLVNGIITVFCKLPSFIVTLATQKAYRGMVYLITGGMVISLPAGSNFRILGQGYVGPIPLPIIIMLLLGIILYIIMDWTRLGRNFYAIGGNREAARASGINLSKYTLFAFLLAGVFAGCAGIVFASRTNSGIPTGAVGFEGEGIAAAVIGGVGFAGGSGSAWGAIIGAFVVGVFSNILNLLGVNPYIQEIITGSIIITAVAVDTWTRSRRVSR
ncbi:MAG: ABC transporter permease [Treponema sp.]|jgi:inositol transport system permease protein|nr:ABC transporter permease [Treponema sp.]